MRGVGLSARGAFKRRSGPDHDPDRMHRHVICTHPDSYGLVLTVSICSRTDRFDDEACPLAQHEHPSLRHASFIAYRHASIVQTKDLAQEIRRGEIAPLDDVNPQLFLKIIKGLGRSMHVEPRIVRYYADRMALPTAA